ncbi:hypothetical protein ACT3UD_17645 [Glutamicibacter sp. 287]|uniref:hypothetical protein n=1 Tax=unclassified Glutamicibacter TaxID=2627139 RepID=UPI000BB84053|nr:hypothetical protein [Glutamicibacter sp. BW80]PCC27264.1 hypothetical protein CIK76_17865 [Glutamicibacter sp. BW80]
MARQVALGGEFKKRGLLSGRSTPEQVVLWTGLGIAACVVLMGMDQFFFLFAGLVIAVLSVVITVPMNIHGGRSYAALKTETAYRAYRKHAGLGVYDPVHEQTALASVQEYRAAKKNKKKAVRPRGFAVRRAERRKEHVQPAPLMVGRLSVKEVDFNARERLAVFRHANSDPAFYTVIFEVRGSAGGVVEEDVEDIPHVGFGRVLARAARRTSAVSHIQSFTRSIPLDITDHVSWLADYVDPNAHGNLVRSYQELCLQVEDRAEQHRSYWVLRFDNRTALQRAANAQQPGPMAVHAAIVQEAQALMAQAVAHKAIRGYRAVDSQMAAGILAHLQDPYTYAIDDTDVGLEAVWQKLDQEQTSKAVVVNNHAYTRVAYIPRDGFMAGSALPVQAMRQLVSGIVPAVIHSVSWVNEVVDAKEARAQAMSDRTSDKAKRHSDASKGKISDGTEQVMSNSSDQRAVDLTPGSGHHGVKWGAYVSFTVDSEEKLLQVSTQIESVATDCGIDRLYWLDHRHDMALMAVLPMGRGIRT